jgi:DNA helicase-2/ATP-dependent DNA helicase PcrA
MKISSFQAAVYANVASGCGNTVVCARAGSGKTTTIMGALSSVPAGLTVALFAFNKGIATELASRAPKGVEVKTLHAHGFSACRRSFPGVKVNENKTREICVDLFGEAPSPGSPEDPIRSRYPSICDLVSKAKDTLVGRDDLEGLDALIDAFDLDAPTEDADRKAFVAAAMRVLVRSSEVTTCVDFGDMCWLPVVLSLRVWAFDRVFVDETQDLSPSQIELLLMCVRRGGRICAVGDDRQAIYGFRGADVDTMSKLIARLDATTLPLSITYRCCRAVTALAASEVPDFTPAETAPQGCVRISGSEFMLSNAKAGDMIISRANAPLIGYCLKLLAGGTRASIKGRDVAEGIIKLVESRRAKSVPMLIERMQAWHKKECVRLAKRTLPSDSADDRLACVLALTENSKSVSDIIARVRALFADDGKGDASRVNLGTTHKLKGLEADRVWMLEDTYRRSRGGEEANCWYVAVTRAKNALYLVSDKDAS